MAGGVTKTSSDKTDMASRDHAPTTCGVVRGEAGGHARAASLSPQRRCEIASNAAKARWARGWIPKPPKPTKREQRLALAGRLLEAAAWLADDIPMGTIEVADLEGDVRLDVLDLYCVNLMREAARALGPQVHPPIREDQN